MTYNIINVSFGVLRKVTAPSINYRLDEKQILVIKDEKLPEYYEVDFCNEGDDKTITMPATAEGVQIPDQLFLSGKPIKAYVVIPDDESVSTRREITMHVNQRPDRSEMQPTPSEQQQIDSLVNQLNEAVSLLQNVGLAVDEDGILYVKTRSDD